MINREEAKAMFRDDIDKKNIMSKIDMIYDSFEKVLEQYQNTPNDNKYVCNQPKPSLCEKRKVVVYCTHDKGCTYKHLV